MDYFSHIRVFSYDCNPSVQLIQLFSLTVFSPIFCAFLFPHHSPPFYLFSFLPILRSVFLCSFSDQSSFFIYSILSFPFFFLYILHFSQKQLHIWIFYRATKYSTLKLPRHLFCLQENSLFQSNVSSISHFPY